MKKNGGFTQVSLFDHKFLTGNETAFNELIRHTVITPANEPLALAHYNLHGLYLCRSQSEMHAYMSTVRYVWLDGMPIYWILKLLGYNVSSVTRITFLDWQHSFFAMANQLNWKVFLLGASADAIGSVQDKLSTEHPNIHFESRSGYFDMSASQSTENTALIGDINNFAPDILIVGMGMPRQESWIHQNRQQLDVKVILPVGGYFDYLTGQTYTPPRWSGKIGMEWLFRLLSDPGRLARRYLIEPWLLVLETARYVLRQKK